MQVCSAAAVPIRLWWQIGALSTVQRMDDQEGNTPEEQSEIAKRGASARWGKTTPKP